MAIIAAALAIVTVLGQIFATKNCWPNKRRQINGRTIQAKSIRRYESDIAREPSQESNSAPAAVDKYRRRIRNDTKRRPKKSRTKPQKLEQESDMRGRQALRFHTGEVFLEIGIVLASLAILTKRRVAWVAAIASACVGVGVRSLS